MLTHRPLIAAPPRLASAFILVAVFLDMAALGISITVLPSLIGRLTAARDAGWVNGAFVGVWALVQFACAPTLGALSDRWGRRPLLLLSMAGLGLDYVVMALAPDLLWLLAGRIVSGATASSFSVCYAYVADLTTAETRTAAYGRLGAAFGLGFVLGPALGGLLGAESARAPFWAAAALSLGNAVFGLLVLPESLPAGRRAPFSWRKANPLGALGLLRSHPELGGLAWTHGLSQLAGASIASVYVLYVVGRFGWSLRTVGASLALVGVLVAVVQGLVLGRVSARLGDRRTLLVGAAAGAASLAGFGLATHGWMVFAAVFAFGLWGLQGPATLALMSRRVSESEQGRLQGALAGLTSLADGVGPFLFGGLFSATAAAAPGAAFLAAAGVMAATGVLASVLLRGGEARAAAAG